MNKRAGSLETTLLKGSCCFPLQLRISGQAAIMAIENAIVAIVIHTLTYTHTYLQYKPDFRQQDPGQGSKTGVCGAAWCCMKRSTWHLPCVAMLRLRLTLFLPSDPGQRHPGGSIAWPLDAVFLGCATEQTWTNLLSTKLLGVSVRNKMSEHATASSWIDITVKSGSD